MNFTTESDSEENVNLSNAIDASDVEDHANLYDVWNAVTTQIYRIVDEDGVNVAEGQCRKLDRYTWIYFDNTDGYQLMDDGDVQKFFLVPQEKHVRFGWDKTGNVIRL